MFLNKDFGRNYLKPLDIEQLRKFQEEALKRGPENPSYKVLDEWGPDKNNDKHFRVRLFLKDEKVAEGEGTNTKEAEKKAAEKGLDLLGWS